LLIFIETIVALLLAEYDGDGKNTKTEKDEW